MEWLVWTGPSSFCLSGSLVSITCIRRDLGLGLGHSLAAGPCWGGLCGSESGEEMGGTDCSSNCADSGCGWRDICRRSLKLRGRGGGSLKSHEEVERQYLPPYLLQILEEQWVASLVPWVSLQIKWLKPLPGSVCS